MMRRHVLLFTLRAVVFLLVTNRSTAWQPPLQPQRPTPASAAPTQWPDFEFAPNGVCLYPARFVDVNDSTKTFTMRNVPGQGDCTFQAVALASFASVGLGANHVLLRAITKELRALTASVLEQGSSSNSDTNTESNYTLVIEDKRLVAASALLKSAARQEGVSTADYLTRLRTEGEYGGLYGGGPELTVLCNLLRRPISIYELAAVNATTTSHAPTLYRPIVRQGTFGGQLFRDPLATVPNSAVQALGNTLLPGAYSWHLHILVVQTSPTIKHACVLLPQQQHKQQEEKKEDKK